MNPRRLLGGLLAVVAGLAVAGAARAASILYYVDMVFGTDAMAHALVNVSASHAVTTAPTLRDFSREIASGAYDLGIFFQQNSAGRNYNTAIAALGTFVVGGGKAIYADWSRNATNGANFDVGYTGDVNFTSLTVVDPALLAGLTNPVGLSAPPTNPTWGFISFGLTGAAAATFEGGQAAIVFGNEGRSITNGFLSDTFVVRAEGVRLYENEIGLLLGTPPVPLPAALPLFASALVGLTGLALLRQRAR